MRLAGQETGKVSRARVGRESKVAGPVRNLESGRGELEADMETSKAGRWNLNS